MIFYIGDTIQTKNWGSWDQQPLKGETREDYLIKRLLSKETNVELSLIKRLLYSVVYHYTVN